MDVERTIEFIAHQQANPAIKFGHPFSDLACI